MTDLPLRVLIAAHFIRGSVVSSLLYPRRTSPSAETKPGKAPKNVDYVGARVLVPVQHCSAEYAVSVIYV